MRKTFRLLATLMLGSLVGCPGTTERADDAELSSGSSQALLSPRRALHEVPATVFDPGALEQPALDSPLERAGELTVASTYTGLALGNCSDVVAPANQGSWRAFSPFGDASAELCAWTWTSAGGEPPSSLHVELLRQARWQSVPAQFERLADVEPELSCSHSSCAPPVVELEVIAATQLGCVCPLPGPILQGMGTCTVCAGDLAGEVLNRRAYLRLTDRMARDADGRVTLLRQDGERVLAIGKVYAPRGTTLIAADVEGADGLLDGLVSVARE